MKYTNIVLWVVSHVMAMFLIAYYLQIGIATNEERYRRGKYDIYVSKTLLNYDKSGLLFAIYRLRVKG